MTDLDLVETICKTCDMGREIIAQVLAKTESIQLHEALFAQAKEYDSIYAQADSLLQALHRPAKEANPLAKIQSQVVIDLKTTFAENSDSAIAEMVIEGSTMGVANMTKQLHGYSGDHKTVVGLAKKLIKTEEANIEQMKHFL